MKIVPTRIPDCMLVDLDVIEDSRGFFARSFCPVELKEAGLGFDFHIHQTNIAFNKSRGTLRGMHWQAEPKPDPKIVRAVSGAIFDVVIDLRKDSPSFGQWTGVELSAENRKAVVVPPGCAHGLITLADNTEVYYLMGETFYPDLARGLAWNDPQFDVQWPIEPVVISDRDKSYPAYEAE